MIRYLTPLSWSTPQTGRDRYASFFCLSGVWIKLSSVSMIVQSPTCLCLCLRCPSLVSLWGSLRSANRLHCFNGWCSGRLQRHHRTHPEIVRTSVLLFCTDISVWICLSSESCPAYLRQKIHLICIHICMNIYSLWPESVSAAVTATRRLRPPWRWQWEEIRATWPQCSAASSSSWPARRLIGWATSAFSSSLLVRLSHTHTHTKHTHISLNHCLSCDESTVWRRQYLFYIYWSFGFCICSA